MFIRTIEILLNSKTSSWTRVINMTWAFSSLTAKQMKAIKELEDKMGVTLLAFSNINIKYANLSEEEMKVLLEAEKDLGVSLVAVHIE